MLRPALVSKLWWEDLDGVQSSGAAVPGGRDSGTVSSA